MSLINEMLRDLEARRAGDLGKQQLQREIRPLPEKGKIIPAWIGISLVGAFLASTAGIGAWWFGIHQAQRLVDGQKSDALPVVPPQLSPAPTAAAGGANHPLSDNLRPAFALANPPAPGRSPEQSGADGLKGKNAPSPNSIPLPMPAAVEVPQGAGRAKDQPAIAQGSIEKSVSPGTPRERAEASHKKAQALLVNGEWEPAQEALLAALKLDPGYSPARQMLLRLYLEARRLEDAAALLQDGLELLPAQTSWAMSLARLQVERSDLAAAERTLARSKAYAGNNAEYAGFHGHLLVRLGRFSEAIEQYQQAARNSPGEGRWWFGLGQALDGDGRRPEARAAFRNALESGTLNADLASLAEQKSR